VAAENQAAGGVPVEPVRRFRPAGEAEAKGVQVVDQGLAALGAGMHRQARGFVDHEHQGIAIEHLRHYLFRIHDASAIEAGA
jgi:hypothetical protein